MKTNFTLLILFILTIQNGYSQITILHNDIGSPNDSCIYSYTSLPMSYSVEATDTNYFWDFSNLSPNFQKTKEYKLVSDVPLIYEVAFFGKASMASPEDDKNTPGIALTEAYSFINKTSYSFKVVGFGGKVNGTPLPVIFNSPDIIYRFPIYYNDVDSSFSDWQASLPNTGYIGEILNRKDTVDGWGIIKTPYGQFSCLRIKSTVYKEDTVYMASSGIGFRIPQHYIEYKWLSKNMKFPIMKATVTEGVITQTDIMYMDSLRSFVGTDSKYCPAPKLRIMPNPAHNFVKIDINSINNTKLQIIDIQGKIIFSTPIINQESINIETSKLAKGVYFVRLHSEDNITIKKLIIE